MRPHKYINKFIKISLAILEEMNGEHAHSNYFLCSISEVTKINELLQLSQN